MTQNKKNLYDSIPYFWSNFESHFIYLYIYYKIKNTKIIIDYTHTKPNGYSIKQKYMRISVKNRSNIIKNNLTQRSF